MGPGTGLGEGYLTKSSFSKCYEVFSSEGGHVDFNITSEEDYKLRQFAIDYIKKTDDEDIPRVSVERLCAGPAIPLIYEFLK
jgi:glucokinase